MSAAVETPGLGHNQGPSYAEEMLEASKPQRERATALIESLNKSKVQSDEDAERITTLATLLRDLKEKMDKERSDLREPHMKAAKDIQDAYKPTIDLLDTAIRSAGAMVDAWRQHLAELAAAEQRKRDAEAEAARRAEEEAQHALEEAQKQGDAAGTIEAELAAMQAREKAERIETAPLAIVPSAPIRAVAGTAGTTTVTTGVITDARKALSWLLKNQNAALLELVQPLVDRNARAGVTVPGVDIKRKPVTRFRR